MSMTPEWAVIAAMGEDPREARLPKYAQETLRVLREALAEQSALAKDAVRATNPEAAKVLLDPFETHGGIGVDDRTTVRFKMGVGYIDCDLRDDWLQVRASDELVIRPRVSNAIDLRDAPRWSTT